MAPIFNTKRSLLALLAAPVLLAACGDTGGGLGGGLGGGGAVDLFAELGEQGAAIESEFALIQFTRQEDLPTTGSASFSGFAAYAEGDDVGAISEIEYATADLVSEVDMNADFAAGTVDGSLTNFQSNNANYEGVQGRVNITNGVFADYDPDYATFGSDLEGEITSSGRSGVVDGLMSGIFVGNDVGAASGALDLEIINGEAPTRLLGTFIAARN
jgi:hypothetical protein